ncbi:TVP38/TMEM64 family protein [Streptacidiphilus sp. MAP5-3]|uniref:TVP38/TMEM64 family protein n=1 Tax=unclassified Streptacidiphilus TaxID=2643834 RepID=UPI00351251D8
MAGLTGQDAPAVVPSTAAPAPVSWLRRTAGPLALVGALAAVAVTVALLGGQRLLSGADPFGGLPAPVAAAVFVVLYAAATVAFVPKPLLNLAAGAWFGLTEGLGLAVVATTLGALASFALARRVGREALRPWLRARAWQALDRELTGHGFRSVLTMRLIPVLPFAVVNCATALGGTPTRPFAAATAVGVLPGTAVLVLAGATASAPGPLGTWLSLAALPALGGATLLPRLRRGSRPRVVLRVVLRGGPRLRRGVDGG